ncbi:MAG: carboxymuconolactone decarboxylase family protein [Alphaproteobacteria bacterium]
MHKDWKQVAKELSGPMAETSRGIPEVGKAFHQLAVAATAEGALDSKTKELIAVSISITARSDGCVAFHVGAAVRHGASREEVLETIGMAIYMGGGPSLIYGAQALEAYDQFAAE